MARPAGVPCSILRCKRGVSRADRGVVGTLPCDRMRSPVWPESRTISRRASAYDAQAGPGVTYRARRSVLQMIQPPLPRDPRPQMPLVPQDLQQVHQRSQCSRAPREHVSSQPPSISTRPSSIRARRCAPTSTESAQGVERRTLGMDLSTM